MVSILQLLGRRKVPSIDFLGKYVNLRFPEDENIGL